MAFAEEFAFTLPRGFMDKGGVVHKQGIMRLATAADEILPMLGSPCTTESRLCPVDYSG